MNPIPLAYNYYSYIPTYGVNAVPTVQAVEPVVESAKPIGAAAMAEKQKAFLNKDKEVEQQNDADDDTVAVEAA